MTRIPLLSQNRLFVFFTAVCIAVNLLAYVLYSHNQKILQSQSWVTHSYEVNRELQEAMIDLLVMKSAHKNYLLFGNAKALDEFKEAKRGLDTQQKLLKRLTGDSISQQLALGTIEKKIDALYAQMQEQAIRRKQISINQAILRDEEAMRQLRTLLDDFRNAETTLLKDRTQLLAVKKDAFIHTLLVSSVLSILGLGLTILVISGLSSQQVATQEKLAESQEQIMLAMQGLNDGIFDANFERGTIYYSPRLKEMLGYSAEEILPEKIQEFREWMHPEDRGAAIANAEKYYAREVPYYANYFRVQSKDGRYRWMMARGQGVWDAQGKIRRMIGAFTDITEQKQVEENLRQSKEELENFTFIASHDLRSPLVNLKGFAGEMIGCLAVITPLIERVIAGLSPDERENVLQSIRQDMPEALHYIQTAVDRMDRLTGAVLDLQRIGKRELRFERIDAQRLVQRLIDVQAHEIQSKAITVQLDALPEAVSDAVALEQIFANLLDNAVKYLDPERKGRIQIRGFAAHGEVRFEVSDNGRGIAEEDREKVFEFFRRAGNSEEIRGEGMGMAYVKSLVNRLGGRIWFTSAPGVGSRFFFTLSDAVSDAA